MSTQGNKSARLFEVSVALEIMRFERDQLHAQITLLQDQLQKATERAERSEARLHEVTMMLAQVSRDALTAPSRSTATEIMMDGRSVLRLNNPIKSLHEPV